MIRLARLGHVALFVADLERARDFYVRLLGYHVLEEESADHGRTAFLEIGELGNTLDLVEAPAGAGAAAAGVPFGRRLHDQGIEILYRVDHGSSQSIYFRDPDGHIIEIYWTPPGGRELWKQGRGDEH